MASALKTPIACLPLLALMSGACSVQDTKIPGLTGPSELALSVAVSATPDSIIRDGASQSAIVVTARDENGKPKAGVSVRLDMSVDGVLQDFGQLTARTVATGSDGRALASYVAPPPPPPAAGGAPAYVTIVATPIGSNYQAANSQTVEIRLVTPGVILPPAGTPTPAFSFSPTPVTIDVPVNFDASRSCAGTSPCASTSGITSFAWNFGDGSTGSGQSLTHAFSTVGTFNVTLTVTNDRGVSASTSQTVTVGAGTAPTASFVYSPTPVVSRTNAYFDASASTTGPGRRIVEYIWNWGDGNAPVSRTTPYEDHAFPAAGSYTVVLIVVDDTGQRGTVNRVVAVQ
jgi:PKD repeat protein